MILLDATVVIDYTRGKHPYLHVLFTTLNLGVCGIVRRCLPAGTPLQIVRN